MARDKPFAFKNYAEKGAKTVKGGAIGAGRLLGADYNPLGDRRPGLDGTATEPSASGTKYYVGDSGDDANSGTSKDSPLRTFATLSEGGANEAHSGDVIVILEEGVTLNDSSNNFVPTDGNITVCGEQGTFPTIQINWSDKTTAIILYGKEGCVFRGFQINGPNSVDNIGTSSDGEAWYGIAIRNCQSSATMPITKSEAKEAGWVYNVKTTRLGNSGIFVGTASKGVVVERCVAAYNYDAGTNGGNADGIQFTSASGDADVVRGSYVLDCVLNHNSDDGIDCYRSRALTIRRCMAYANGYREDGTKDTVDTPGKGIKVGGSEDAYDIGGSLVERCISFNNGAAGFGANGSNLPVDFIYCTAWNNARKDARDYELDYELYEYPGSHPSGYNLYKSRIVGCIGEQGVYESFESGSLDSTNVVTCNFDYNNNFSPTFSNIEFADTEWDSQSYPINYNRVGCLPASADENSHPDIINSGTDGYMPTPASDYHGNTSSVGYFGSSPDLGATETRAESLAVADVTDYGAAGDGSTDDTQAIIDAANDVGKGGTVYFPAGTYLIGSNSNNPLTYPGDGSWDNITWKGESWDSATVKMASGHDSAYYTGWRFGNGTVTDGTWKELTIDGNKSNNGHDNSAAIYSDSNDAGTFTFVDCRIKDWRGGGLNFKGGTSDLDVKYCEFRDQGKASGAGGSHDINCNMDNSSTVAIKHSHFVGTAGECIDVGDDSSNSYMTVTADWCLFEGMRGGFKLDPENKQTTISNCHFIGGSYTTLSGAKANNSNYNCGSIRVNDSIVEGGSWPGIGVNAGDFDDYELYNVAVKDVDNGDNAGQGIDARDAAVNCGSISVHNVGSSNDGDAVFFGSNCTGSIEEIRRDGTGGLGTTNSVTVKKDKNGEAPLGPSVATETEVGPRGTGSYYDVTDYGAAGDGSTNDTQAIRDAANDAGPNGVVYFPSGEYIVGANSQYPFDYPDGGDWDNITWLGESWDNTKITMAGGHTNWNMMFRSRNLSTPPTDVAFRELTIDMNGANNQDAPGNHFFRMYEGSGTFTMDACRFQDGLSSFVIVNDVVDIQADYCSFYDCGDVDKSNYSHPINPNQEGGDTTTNINNTLFKRSVGSDVDVGIDGQANEVTVNIDTCISVNSGRLVKASNGNKKTTITNTRVDSDTGRAGNAEFELVAINNDTKSNGALEMDTVLLQECPRGAIDIAAPANTITLENIEVYDCNEDNRRDQLGEPVSVYIDGNEVSDVQGTDISVHDTGSTDDGYAVWFDNGLTGSLNSITFDSDESVGDVGNVSVGSTGSGSRLGVTVPTESEVGPGAK